jgi:hypothetical protein
MLVAPCVPLFMDQMKKDINKAAQEQADRFEKTDESAEEK